MKKLKVSGVDLGAIIVFVVLTLGGVGGWYYLTGTLSDAQSHAQTAKQALDRYAKDRTFKVAVSHPNVSTLQGNIDTYKAQLDPLIQSVFFSKDDRLNTVTKEDPVAWKHDLDDEVRTLNGAAKRNSVTVPLNFFFGFSRYQSQSPGDEQTAVLTKQLLGIEQITNILVNAPVKNIQAIRRTYEEDTHPGAGAVGPGDPDFLPGNAYSVPGNVYTAYPFEVDFVASPENLRPVINGLIQSPYVLVLRSLTITSDHGASPKLSAQAEMAGGSPDSGAMASPGEVGQTPTKGPQFLFGNANIQVKARIDMIEWTYQVPVKKP